MQQEDQQLASDCRALAHNTKNALTWLEHNRESVGKEYDSLHTELRRAMRSFNKCEIAAMRKMCVGVFGPSQSGKSYLISALARDAQGALIADFDGAQHDFITEINPEGGKESTGLVTRFTTTQPPNLPQGHPIRLRLLTECDVVRVLANTYYADCEHKEEPDQEALLTALAALEAHKNPHAQEIVTADDVEELREYLLRNFVSRPRVQLLQKIYWQRAAMLAPQLDLQGRTKLFGLIWDSVEEFNTLFYTLSNALQALGNPAEAHCPIEALIPRDSSIIDVALLKNLAQCTDNNADMLSVMGHNNIKISLPRPIVTALTAEITIYMREKPDDFFDHTDLLDFPGYRSRLKLDNVRRELTREGTLENLFLRGKVAYLFERYCAEKELTSMLLCIGPGNQEVQDLPRAVQQWIASTHGESPARRAGSDPALFFVLSKMDMEFEKKKGTPSVETRWTTRLQSSLLDFFGKQDDWPTNWDGHKAFNNVFLLRNPNFRCEAIFTFDGDKEIGIRPEQKDYVEEVKNAFLTSELVQTHVSDPKRIWDAAMTLNDGGVGLLRQVLRPLCLPILKRKQILVTLNQSLERVTSILTPHWKTDNKEEERTCKTQLATQLVKILATSAAKQLFGRLLRSLQVHDHHLHALYFRAEQERLQQEDTPSVLVGTRVEVDDIMDDILGITEPEPAAIAKDTATINYKDETERFTDLVIQHWIEQMHSFAASPNNQKIFDFPEKELGLFVHELVKALSRLDIAAHMTKTQRQASGYGNLARERLVWKQVSLAADAINSFVDWLGFDPRESTDSERTVIIQGKPVVLFKPKEEVANPPHIGEEALPYDKLWYTDWLRAFLHTVIANVDFDDGVTFNREQNALLHTILTNFTTPEVQ